MAERKGFEPLPGYCPATAFRVRTLRPLGYLSGCRIIISDGHAKCKGKYFLFRVYKLKRNLYITIDKSLRQVYDTAMREGGAGRRAPGKEGFPMKKTLYSLMLNDEVVREVDAMAHRMGTNRSSLINQILAEYVGYTTPERRINDVLSAIQALLSPSRDLVPFFAPNSSSMSLKSSLEYKYRPTVKYEVELYRGGGESIGELSVLFRTQSAPLLQAMTEFFRLWKRIEDVHLAPATGARIDYALYDGKFLRSIAVPERDCTAEELAGAISEYIQLFDRLMKGYLSGRFDAHEVEAAYFAHMTQAKIHI